MTYSQIIRTSTEILWGFALVPWIVPVYPTVLGTVDTIGSDGSLASLTNRLLELNFELAREHFLILPSTSGSF